MRAADVADVLETRAKLRPGNAPFGKIEERLPILFGGFDKWI
jgi:hypothetical protein